MIMVVNNRMSLYDPMYVLETNIHSRSVQKTECKINYSDNHYASQSTSFCHDSHVFGNLHLIFGQVKHRH